MARVSQRGKVSLRYDEMDAAAVQPEFEAAIRRARALERESALILGGRSRTVLVEMSYTILVYLLSVLDAVRAEEGVDARSTSKRVRVRAAPVCANSERDRLDTFAQAASVKASLRW